MPTDHPPPDAPTRPPFSPCLCLFIGLGVGLVWGLGTLRHFLDLGVGLSLLHLVNRVLSGGVAGWFYGRHPRRRLLTLAACCVTSAALELVTHVPSTWLMVYLMGGLVQGLVVGAFTVLLCRWFSGGP